jgi:hypothetical protein
MNNTPNKQVYKTFCKVCQDSGKLEKDYTNHNVRDARGVTCCPTLLAQECRNCYKKGHTSKYCSVKAPLAAQVTTVKVALKQVNQVKKETVKAQKNMFMCLDSDSEDEEEEIIKPRTAPAPVPVAELKIAQKQALNYGKIIALAPQIVKKEEVAAFIKESNKVTNPTKVKVKVPFSWANCESDSDGSDEEEEEC